MLRIGHFVGGWVGMGVLMHSFVKDVVLAEQQTAVWQPDSVFSGK